MKGILNQEIEEEKEISGLLTIAKENMVRTFERRYEEKINTRSQELKKDYEEQYRAKIDELEEKVEQQDNIIANHKQEIKDLKGKDKENKERIDQFEEDFHKKEGELETIKTDNSVLKMLFDFYKTKIGYLK